MERQKEKTRDPQSWLLHSCIAAFAHKYFREVNFPLNTSILNLPLWFGLQRESREETKDLTLPKKQLLWKSGKSVTFPPLFSTFFGLMNFCGYFWFWAFFSIEFVDVERFFSKSPTLLAGCTGKVKGKVKVKKCSAKHVRTLYKVYFGS